MDRFVFFVDGSNLTGSFINMGVRVDDYERFFGYVFERAKETYNDRRFASPPSTARLARVNWYEVGMMDNWDLNDMRAIEALRKRFYEDDQLKRLYMAQVGPQLAGSSQDKVFIAAFDACMKDGREWYEGRRKRLESLQRFHHAIRSSTNFIDIHECGYWKVDILHQTMSEKRLDTTLAVDMVALELTYDVAVVFSGDADAIPSINYMKERGKTVAAVEFLNGYPPETRGRGFSSHLKLAADFVVQIYEMDLCREKIAYKSQQPAVYDVPAPEV